MSRTIIDINIIQTLPPSNINRDDTGSPKTATFGGSRRARVSSQAWKRATREAFSGFLSSDDLGTRTKRVVELLAERIVEKNTEISVEAAQKLAAQIFGAAGIKLSAARGASKENPLPEESGYLLFLSSRQIDRLADIAIDAYGADDVTAAVKAAKPKSILAETNSIDLALFGRMVADVTDLNVDAAAQVAHAISVHPVENEFDYFTAVDDHKSADNEEDAGAGMIGTVEFNSSTLYRYATVDVDRLHDNLGDAQATRRAVEAFLQAFTRSVPSGKQNTFANRTLPDALVISVRDTQPVNLAGAFEEAILETPRLRIASERLAAQFRQIDETFGTTPVASWVVRVAASADDLDALGTSASLDGAVTAVGDLVQSRLGA